MRTGAVHVSKVFTLIILVLAIGLEPTKQEGHTKAPANCAALNNGTSGVRVPTAQP